MRDVLFRGKKTIDGDCAFGNLETSPIGVAHIIEDYFFMQYKQKPFPNFREDLTQKKTVSLKTILLKKRAVIVAL